MYLIAKRFDSEGCVAIRVDSGEERVRLESRLIKQVGINDIQLVTLNNPSAYGEYAPYRFVDSPEIFEGEVLRMHTRN